MRSLVGRLHEFAAARPHARRLSANFAWLAGERVLRLATVLVVGTLVARYLGPEQFGILSYALAIVSLVGAGAALGIDAIVVRDLVRESAKRDEILGTALLLKLAGGSLGALGACAVAVATSFERPIVVAIVAVLAAGFVFQTADVARLYFESQMRGKLAACASMTALLVASLARVYLVLDEFPLIWFAFVSFGEMAIATLAGAILYRSLGSGFTGWRWSFARAKALLRAGWPLALSALAITIYMKIDIVMLNHMLDARAAGLYAAAVRLSEAWYFIPSAFIASVTPSITAAKLASDELYIDRMRRTVALLTIVALVISVPVALAAPWLVSLLFGPDYAGAAPILAVHICATVFVFLGCALHPWMVNEGCTRVAFENTAAGAVVNVVLNLLLIPAYGAIGAAIATVIAQATSAVLLNAVRATTRPLFYMQMSAAVQALRAGRL
jgi:PST family polysaccharide transporter